ncbi:MAG: transmembrane 220 family protein [Granulosicoccus sp.]
MLPAMRYVYLLLALVMLLFGMVQYNDPDGMIWMVIYLIPAVWSIIAAFYRPLLDRKFTILLLSASILAAIAGTLYFWPDVPQWWSRQVWMQAESAREGMGMMVVTAVLLTVWVPTRGMRKIPAS